MKRLGAPKCNILVIEANLAVTYESLGRYEQALQMKRDVYYGEVELYGEEDERTLGGAQNCAAGLVALGRYDLAKPWLRNQIPIASRVLGNSDVHTLVMKKMYGRALYKDPGATLADLRDAVTTLEETERTMRRVLGGAHPHAVSIEQYLRDGRAALRAREAQPPPQA